jgi:hypothetical protein
MSTTTNNAAGTRRATAKPSLSACHTSEHEAAALSSTIDWSNGANPSRSGGSGGGGSARISSLKLLRGGASSSSSQPPVLLTTVMVAIAVCCVASIAMSTTHVQYQFGNSSSSSSSSSMNNNGASIVDSRPSKQQQQQHQQRTHGVAAALSDFHGKQNKEKSKEDASLLPFYPKLQCKPYGGPNEKEAQEMVYWQGEW